MGLLLLALVPVACILKCDFKLIAMHVAAGPAAAPAVVGPMPQAPSCRSQGWQAVAKRRHGRARPAYSFLLSALAAVAAASARESNTLRLLLQRALAPPNQTGAELDVVDSKHTRAAFLALRNGSKASARVEAEAPPTALAGAVKFETGVEGLVCVLPSPSATFEVTIASVVALEPSAGLQFVRLNRLRYAARRGIGVCELQPTAAAVARWQRGHSGDYGYGFFSGRADPLGPTFSAGAGAAGIDPRWLKPLLAAMILTSVRLRHRVRWLVLVDMDMAWLAARGAGSAAPLPRAALPGPPPSGVADVYVCGAWHLLRSVRLSNGSRPTAEYTQANTGLMALRNSAFVTGLFLPRWHHSTQTQTALPHTVGDQAGLIAWCWSSRRACVQSVAPMEELLGAAGKPQFYYHPAAAARREPSPLWLLMGLAPPASAWRNSTGGDLASAGPAAEPQHSYSVWHLAGSPAKFELLECVFGLAQSCSAYRDIYGSDQQAVDQLDANFLGLGTTLQYACRANRLPASRPCGTGLLRRAARTRMLRRFASSSRTHAHEHSPGPGLDDGAGGASFAAGLRCVFDRGHRYHQRWALPASPVILNHSPPGEGCCRLCLTTAGCTHFTQRWQSCWLLRIRNADATGGGEQREANLTGHSMAPWRRIAIDAVSGRVLGPPGSTVLLSSYF